jgi:GR25 family glycosyltransferase involved in LPS biosynthesis
MNSKKKLIIVVILIIILIIRKKNVKKNKINVRYYCINLERREDRKELMQRQFSEQKIDVEFVKAVDGKLLEPSDDLKELFRDNDFHYRRGVIGCALSHVNLWKRIIAMDSSEPVCIFEDDALLVQNYSACLQNVLKKLPKDVDVLFLSYHRNHQNQQNQQQVITPFDSENYIGGTYNYIITTKGAKKMLEVVNTNGIQNAIDVFMKKQSNTIKIYEVTTFLCESEWVQTINSNVDSDIQLTSDSLFPEE